MATNTGSGTFFFRAFYEGDTPVQVSLGIQFVGAVDRTAAQTDGSADGWNS